MKRPEGLEVEGRRGYDGYGRREYWVEETTKDYETRGVGFPK